MTNTMKIPVREITKNLTITLTVNKYELWLRLKLAALIIRFGCFVGGCKFELEVKTK